MNGRIGVLLLGCVVWGSGGHCVGEQPVERVVLDLVNRARADPAGEAARYGIGLNAGLPDGTISEEPKQPLAMSARLSEAARGHSAWILEADEFSHEGRGGKDGYDRIVESGYPLSGIWEIGENLALREDGADAEVAEEIHRGLFLSPSHRRNLLNPDFDEIGIGVSRGEFRFGDGSVQRSAVATQKFATSGGTPGPLVTGSVFYDLDGDGRYSPGEGVPGIGVGVPLVGAEGVTTGAGGFEIPVGVGGVYDFVFTDATGREFQRSQWVAGASNTRMMVGLDYQPPMIEGPSGVLGGEATTYTFESLWGLMSHDVTASALRAARAYGAEDGQTRPRIDQSSGYSVIQADVRAVGNKAYHLAHPRPERQEILLGGRYYVGVGGVLEFRSRLATATGTQVARVKARLAGEQAWRVVWSRSGNGWPGADGFERVRLPMPDYAGEVIELAFHYDFDGGTYYPQVSGDFGWFVDEIRPDGMFLLEDMPELVDVHSSGFEFRPEDNGDYLLMVSPVLANRQLKGTALRVDVTGGGPSGTPPSPAPVVGGATPDYNRDGFADILVQNTGTGQLVAVMMRGADMLGQSVLSHAVGGAWVSVAEADMDGDGMTDIVWQNAANGKIAVWLMHGTALIESRWFLDGYGNVMEAGKAWVISAVADLDRDGDQDLIWQNTRSGVIAVWWMEGAVYEGGELLATRAASASWRVVAATDWNGDGSQDLVWQNVIDGSTAIWHLDGVEVTGFHRPSDQVGASDWHVRAARDMNGDGPSDLVWQHVRSGRSALWYRESNGSLMLSVEVPGLPLEGWRLSGTIR